MYKKRGFTLAEVLITLAAIGTIAAMTIPPMVMNYKKHAALQRLKSTYNTLNDAIELAVIDHGWTSAWTGVTTGSGASALTFFNTYLKEYLQYSKLEVPSGDSSIAVVTLNNGASVSFRQAGALDVTVFLDGYDKPSTAGRNVFNFTFKFTSTGDPFVPYDYATSGTGRAKWTTGDASYTCNSTDKSSTKAYCAGLIMYDGWKMKDDYPW